MDEEKLKKIKKELELFRNRTISAIFNSNMPETDYMETIRYDDVLTCINELESENAALRERLEKAEAEKGKLNPYIEQDNNGDYRVYRAEYILQYIIDSICLTPEAALTRLAELKGGAK